MGKWCAQRRAGTDKGLLSIVNPEPFGAEFFASLVDGDALWLGFTLLEAALVEWEVWDVLDPGTILVSGSVEEPSAGGWSISTGLIVAPGQTVQAHLRAPGGAWHLTNEITYEV